MYHIIGLNYMCTIMMFWLATTANNAYKVSLYPNYRPYQSTRAIWNHGYIYDFTLTDLRLIS